MAYALVGTIGVASQGAASAAVTPAWGAGESRTAGNLLICFYGQTQSITAPSTPSGWSLGILGATGNATRTAIFYKIAVGGDAAPTLNAVTSAFIAAQLAEFSGNSASPLDQSGTVNGTTSPQTATFGGADTASGELLLIVSADARSAARTPTDTLTSNHASITQAGNNNAASSANHYSFGYSLATTSNSGANTAILTTSVTTSLTGMSVAAATFKLAAVVNTKDLTATLSPTAVLNKKISGGGFIATLSLAGILVSGKKYFRTFTAAILSDYINIIDSYPEANYASQVFTVSGALNPSAAQSFTGNGAILRSCAFHLSQNNPITGTVFANLYAHTGAFGTTSKPTGTPLATSDSIDASQITAGNPILYGFHFYNPFTLVNGTNYCIAVEYDGGDSTHYVEVSRDSSSPTHPGNASILSGGTWSASTSDLIFYCNSTPLAGSLFKSKSQVLSATLSFVGDLATSFIAGGGHVFTQSYAATLSFVGNFAKGLLYLRNFSATLFPTPSGAPVLDHSYSYTPNTGIQLFPTGNSAGGVVFTSGGGALSSSVLSSYKVGSPSGTVSSELWSVSAGLPVALLATSDPVNMVSLATSTFINITFTFSGANQYALINGTQYAIVMRPTAGDGSNCIYITYTAGADDPTGVGVYLVASWGVTASDPASAVYVTPISPPTAALTLNTFKTLAATFASVAALSRRIGKSLTATLTSTAALIKKYLDAGFTATLSFVGNLAASKTFLRALTATLSFTGALSRRTGKTLSATFSPIAVLVKKYIDSGFTATLSFVGAIAKNIRKSLSATLSFVGNLAVSKLFVRAFTASLSFTGTLSRRIGKALSATLSFVGDLATSFIAGGGHLFTQSLIATLSFSGAINRRTGKALSAVLSFIGALTKSIRDAGFTAALSFVGNLSIRKLFQRAFTATLSFVGAFSVSKSFLKAFTATLSFVGNLNVLRLLVRAFTATLNTTGTLRRSTSKVLSATLVLSGALVRRVTRTFTATLSFVGALVGTAVHFFTRSFTATLSFTGNLLPPRKLFVRAFTATLSFAGAIRRQTGKSLTATLSFSTALRKAIRKGLAAVLSFAAFFFKGGAVEIFAGMITKCLALIGISGSTARIAQAGSQLEIVELESGATIPTTGSQLRVERTK